MMQNLPRWTRGTPNDRRVVGMGCGEKRPPRTPHLKRIY